MLGGKNKGEQRGVAYLIRWLALYAAGLAFFEQEKYLTRYFKKIIPFLVDFSDCAHRRGETNNYVLLLERAGVAIVAASKPARNILECDSKKQIETIRRILSKYKIIVTVLPRYLWFGS